MFVANTPQDTLVKIPAGGEPLKPGKPEVFVNRVGGGPDGILIDEHDNIWVACNQSNEVLVIEPTQGRVIAKLGDFGGIDKDGAPIGFLWSNTLAFHGDEVLVTNLSLDVAKYTSQSLSGPTLRTIYGPWADEVKLHTVSKIKKRIPRAFRNDRNAHDSPIWKLGLTKSAPAITGEVAAARRQPEAPAHQPTTTRGLNLEVTIMKDLPNDQRSSRAKNLARGHCKS